MGEQCETCKFYQGDKVAPQDHRGECYAKPPVQNWQGVWVRPLVSAGDAACMFHEERVYDGCA
jgi:hypothetical protein